jgi:hypothetical protein
MGRFANKPTIRCSRNFSGSRASQSVLRAPCLIEPLDFVARRGPFVFEPALHHPNGEPCWAIRRFERITERTIARRRPPLVHSSATCCQPPFAGVFSRPQIAVRDPGNTMGFYSMSAGRLPIATFAFAVVAAWPVFANAPDRATLDKIAKLSVPFVPNAGQWDVRAAFAAKTFAGTLFVTKQGELVYSLPGKPVEVGANSTALGGVVGAGSTALGSAYEATSSRRLQEHRPIERTSGWVLSETLVDRNGQPRRMAESTLKAPAGYVPMEGKVSYGIGNDPAKHGNNLNTYERVNLGDMYPGVNVQLRATGNNVEKIFTVAPQHDPKQINIKLAGADKLEIGAQGELIAHTGNGPVSFTAPIAFQDTESGERIAVDVAYALNASAERYSFAVGPYDPTRPLVIDPLLQSTYHGGTGSDRAYALAIHPVTGDVLIAGETDSSDLPSVSVASGGVATGAQSVKSTGTDAFVTRFNAALTNCLQSSYLGGTGTDIAYALAIHPVSGEVYIAGSTNSVDLPSVTTTSGGTAVGAQSVYGGGTSDAFATRFDATLTQRLQSTYLGGSGYDDASALAISAASGEVYIAGSTNSEDLPSVTGASGGDTTGAQATFGGGTQDAFLTNFDALLTKRRQSSYLGGVGFDSASALAIHPMSGEVYIAGSTASPDLPSVTTSSGGDSNGAQDVFGGGLADAFLTRFNAVLSQRLQSTYLGGTGRDSANAMVIHPDSGDIYIAGFTDSADLPGVTPASGGFGTGVQDTYSGGAFDMFLSRFGSSLTTLSQSTYVGTELDDLSSAVTIHKATREVYVAGGIGNVILGEYSAFATSLSEDLTSSSFGLFLGDPIASTIATTISVHPTNGEVYLAGYTSSSALRQRTGGAQATFAGGFDAFVSRLSYNLSQSAIACSMDIDGSGGAPNAVSDGMMFLRAMLGLSDTAITSGAISGSPARRTWPMIRHYLNNSCGTNFAPVVRPPFVGTACDLDLDGSGGAPNAASDGLMLVRAMLGFTGTDVTNGAVAGSPPRSTWAHIRPYLNANCGTSFAP